MTNEEAKFLIDMLKRLVAKRFELPNLGDLREYDIHGIEHPKYRFIYVINRKVKISDKCTFIVRDKNTNTNLLRLDVGNSIEHKNPDGTSIKGTHLHIFKEEHNTNNNIPYAIEFDIDNPSLEEYCLDFLRYFNVLEYPPFHANLFLS